MSNTEFCKKPFINRAITYDGENYYLNRVSLCGNTSYLMKLDENFSVIKCREIKSRVGAISYDKRDNKLWISLINDNYNLYSLNLDLEDSDEKIELKSALINSSINGIDRDCKNGDFLVAYKKTIIRFCCTGCQKKVERRAGVNESFTDVSSMNPYLSFLSRKNNVAKFSVLNNSGEIEMCCNIGDDKNPISMFYKAKMKGHKELEYTVLSINRNNKSSIAEVEVDLNDLKLSVCCCNFLKEDEDDEDLENDNSSDKIIKSIALMEASLANILNEEGNKIQRAVESNESLDKILEVNKSVQDTISKVIDLEKVLAEKLRLAKR